MTDNPTDILPLWMLIAASFGLMIGWTCGDEVRRRKNVEQQLDDLHERLGQSTSDVPSLTRMIKEQRGVINDIHKRLVAVSKGLQKQPR
jgi:septal ring factor EnvC (AmiA/AmiB activator)